MRSERGESEELLTDIAPHLSTLAWLRGPSPICQKKGVGADNVIFHKKRRAAFPCFST
jgi:hypothetical protein